MLIFKRKDDSYKKILKNFLISIIKTKFNIAVFPIIILVIGISTPLNLWNKGDKIVRIALAPLSNIDKRLYFLSKELHAYGDNIITIGFRYAKSQIIPLESLKLNLSFKNISKLRNLRNKAIKDKILLRSENDQVKGNLLFSKESYPVELRLKGDWTDHLLGEKWSFRVKTKKDKFFKGMSEFSLQHPRTRNYINEFIFHKLLEYENLPFLRYEFIPFYVNGKYLGIYALEEHFSKRLIENSGYREGPIIKLSDSDLRNEWLRKKKIDNADNYIPLNKKNAEINLFNAKSISKKPEQLSQFYLASSLFEKYLKKELRSRDVFDLETTAKYLALSDLLQSTRNNTWYDMRFYFNPVLARLIPIGYDAQPPIKVRERLLSSDKNTLELFEDKLFFKEYLKQLERISDPKYLEHFNKFIEKDLKAQLKIINKSYPHIKFLESQIINNQKYLRTRLNPFNPLIVSISKPISNNSNLKLNFANKSSLPIEITKLSIGKIELSPVSNNFLDGHSNNERINYKELELKSNKKFDNNFIKGKDVLLSYRIIGTNKIKGQKIYLFPWTQKSNLYNPIIERKSSQNLFRGIETFENRKKIIINSDVKIDKPLIIPRGYKLIVMAGSKISIKDKGFLLSRDSIEILGEKEKPVIFKGNENGNGILVINAEEKSIIRNATFSKLSNINTKSTKITGALTFYNSKVEISNTTFKNLIGEDALNIINSEFKIINSNFSDLESDALDLDFSNGEIINTNFKDIGNDAIDISGSEVLVRDVFIDKAGDKAISVGEEGDLKLQNSFISNSFIGIASKDLSNSKIKNLKIFNLKYCLAAYKKKNEYGPGLIKINASDKNCYENYLLEKKSKIFTNGKPLKVNSKNVFDQIYNNYN